MAEEGSKGAEQAEVVVHTIQLSSSCPSKRELGRLLYSLDEKYKRRSAAVGVDI